MELRSLPLVGMIVCLAVSPASASSIGVYFASDASDCDATVTANQAFSFYVLANLYGDETVNGISGAEFRIRNWPAGWASTATPNPATNISLGNPLAEGARIGFGTCQPPGVNGVVLLYTIDAVATTAVMNLALVVDKHTTPSFPALPCPLLTSCGFEFPFHCVAGGQALINGPPCSTGAAPSTWTQVKALYRID
jgi:hypothetical protein